MKMPGLKTLVRGISALWLALVALPGWAVCTGNFPNPVTDICWSCAMPISIAGAASVSIGSQEDTDNPSTGLCACGNPPKVGITVSFWEPLRMADVTPTPFCMPALGGVQLNPGVDATVGGVGQRNKATMHGPKEAFYHVHWYINPLMYWLEVLLDNNCLEKGFLDIADLSEVKPWHADPELAIILTPEAALTANPIAMTAGAADTLAATAGWPLDSIPWWSNGPALPPTGYVGFTSAAQATSQMLYREIYTLHREGTQWSASGDEGLCGYYPRLIPKKTDYKYALLNPIPQTKKTVLGRCCQPLGRSPLIWGSGTDLPYLPDFSYMIYRKRNCCQGAIVN